MIGIDSQDASRPPQATPVVRSVADEGKNGFIEVWRGIAVMIVVYYHYVDRIPASSFGDVGSPYVPFYSGKMGVLTFFLISGFLIAKSLSFSKNVADFYAKRLSRIWPLFIVATFFIYFFLQFVPPPVVMDGPKRFYSETRTIWDLFGSLLFLEDLGFKWVDGVYWSILVELKFYFYIGLMAAIWPRSFDVKFAGVAAVLGLAELSSEIFLPVEYHLITRLLNGLFIAQYLPFFALGVLLYTRRTGALFTINALLVMAFIGVKVASNPNFEVLGTLRFMVALIVVLAVDILFLRERIFLFFGKYSYSIYLFHQMIGLALIGVFAQRFGINGAALMAFAIVLAISVAMSELFEWRWRKQTTVLLRRAFSAVGLDRLRIQNARTPDPLPAIATA